jgi:hypothetical protein
MTKRKRHPESGDKAGESGKPGAESATPMERFRKMTRRLVRVSRKELDEARRIAERDKRRDD